MARKFALPLVLLLCLAPASASASAETPIGVSQQIAVERTLDRVERATSSSSSADAGACPAQDAAASSPAELQEAMLCLTNLARARAGLPPLAQNEELDRSAGGKVGDVLSCDSFSHFACGRDFTYWIRAAGYIGEDCWHAGENLAWGVGRFGSASAIFRAWMASPTHRRNILGDYAQVGIALARGNLEGNPGAQVWAAHFGSRCEG